MHKSLVRIRGVTSTLMRPSLSCAGMANGFPSSRGDLRATARRTSMVDGQRRGFIDVTPAWGRETRSSHNLRKFSYSPVGEDVEAFVDSNVEADAPAN